MNRHLSTDQIALIPRRGCVLIAKLPAPDKRKSGLHLTGGLQRLVMFARVIRLGPCEVDEKGEEIPFDYEPGDVVMMPRESNPRTGQPYGAEPWIACEGYEHLMIVPEMVIQAKVRGYDETTPQEAEEDNGEWPQGSPIIQP